jgi:heme-degrading monooxygenase HmoA
MASRFEVRSVLDSFRFLLKSFQVWGQLRHAPGAIGGALLAHPFKRVFFTLSAWEDRDALYTFAKTEPHRSIMRGMKQVMRTSTFTFWELPAAETPISWEDAKQRIGQAADADPGKAAANRPETPS